MGSKKKHRHTERNSPPTVPARAGSDLSASPPPITKPWIYASRVLGILAVVFFAVYFRTYQLRAPSLFATKTILQEAEQRILLNMQVGLLRAIQAEHPDFSDVQKKELLEYRMKELMTTNSGQYRETVQSVYDDMIRKRYPRYARRYLLDPDSYYYYGLARHVDETGTLGEDFKGGLFYNPLRHVPEGLWDWNTLHPYLGVFWSRLIRIFFPDMPLAEALAYYPILTVVLMIGLFLFLCRVLRIDFFSSLIGTFNLALGAMVIQRTAFGWFDTDVYHFIFIPLILTSLFFALRSPARGYAWGVVSGALVAFYSLFWSGWLFVYFLMGMGTAAVAVFRFAEARGRQRWKAFGLPLVYGVSGLLFAVLFLTPAGFGETLTETFAYSRMTAADQPGMWPNIFVWIGEDRPISFRKLIFLTCSPLLAPVVALGFFYSAVVFWKQRKETPGFYFWIMLTAVAVPVCYLSMRTAQRFTAFAAVPVAIYLAWGVGAILRFANGLSARVRAGGLLRRILRGLTLAGILLLAVPQTFILAHVRAMARVPIMNDSWDEVLGKLRTLTPSDAYVASWWTAGHFITSVARRRVSIDGMNMHFPDTFWVARAFISADEKETCGIFRMLATSGNQAMEFLAEKKIPLDRAASLILETVRLGRAAALEVLRQALGEKDARSVLELTHGKADAVRPAYVLIYSSMIEHNVIIQMAGRWDFAKAARSGSLADQTSQFEALFSKTAGKYEKKYLSRMFTISGQPWNFEAKQPAIRAENRRLEFANGLAIDLENKKAFFDRYQGSQVPARELNLSFVDQGKIMRFDAGSEPAPFTAILFQENGSPSAVVADVRLAESVLFQLRFLDGAAFSFFKPFAASRDRYSGDVVMAYEIDWPAFLRATETGTPEPLPAA